MKKIGIYGGSFDPVHLGHLKFADSAIKLLDLNGITVLPAAASPFKSKSLTGDDIRLAMCKAAFSAGPYTVSDYEIKKGGKSYTVDTLTYFKRQFPDTEFYLLLGADQFLQFDKWYRYRDILKLAVIVGMARDNQEQADEMNRYAIQHIAPYGKYRILSAEPFPVSSTQIRRLCRQKQSIHGLVPQETEHIIIQKGLYQHDN